MPRLYDPVAEPVAEPTIEPLPELPPVPEPDPADAAVLARAAWHGRRSRAYLGGWAFDDAEAELRAGWLLNGETARWRDVRDAVRRGFETDAGR
jgi:hypothetical protein